MWATLIGLAATLLSKLFGSGESEARKDGRATGQAETRDAVSSEALKRSEADRKSKEHTDAVVRNTPDDDLIARL